MQQYFWSTLIEICQRKGFALATPNRKKKRTTVKGNEPSEVSRNVPERKENTDQQQKWEEARRVKRKEY